MEFLEKLKRDEEILKEAILKEMFLDAYIFCHALLHRMLELSLRIPHCSIEDYLHLLRNRCLSCLSVENRISDHLIDELMSISMERDYQLDSLRYQELNNANSKFRGISKIFYEKYLELREWFEVYGQEVNYQEGIIISKAKDRLIDLFELIKYLEGIDSHSILDPYPIKEKLNALGFEVDILICGKSNKKDGMTIFECIGTWGKPGIAALSLVAELVEIITGVKASSTRIGIGFQFEEYLEKIRIFNKLSKNSNK